MNTFLGYGPALLEISTSFALEASSPRPVVSLGDEPALRPACAGASHMSVLRRPAEFSISKTSDQVIVYQSGSLHVRVDYRRSDKSEPSRFEVLAEGE